MPLYKTIQPNSQTTVKIWKIEESYTDLMQPLDLKPDSLERVLGMKSELHQRGFLSVRHLLREFGYTDQDLYYDAHGKPHLKDGKHISITHSFTFSGVIISASEVGIDIEMQREKIAIIAKKFVDYEFNYLSETDKDYIQKLTVVWGIKESLYKLFATPGMLFRQHFLVIPFMLKDGETVAWIDYQDRKYKYDTYFLEFEGFTCAYALG
ncbi:4'-phosphopantetheinyl transferase superfamily protein [Subsaximicrobium wynnwilliamsii]|uniref:4'-phosphopantetheinyl transferase superfamily protein n=1 Tax=Subsaximicrobium wynnwilliamsii TaxID=291179 RepID=A0A5C6ZL99_9FLAO|nr:4'-phosphopantetheinyl transferase superfamily protein [Subsaximicrobium wynnwilliamsii]TXD83699.1 4'-phosphopantetheinyl transferase superfamily protein [Subsaximicrobium wynnwilliamsii]TXD89417.1 4'-phosphopantetheinyl transferase superfamily protein [Subsaximicrobium wynnwilliamsii]TXE03536.1 4'-phosphopantetheinyl transferase superfamily protein [Subsaximicrobium wynnwilliamsii]